MTLVMGVLNVTPDSFSDGGRWLDPGAAVAHGLELVGEGADIVDVGGESTRPGADRVDGDEERRRVLPVIRRLAAEGVTVSVDTRDAETARRALDAGAGIVNDVSAGKHDAGMARVVADTGARYVAMHSRGPADAAADYADVVPEVVAELANRVVALADAGVDPERVILDPGLGFAKTADHNWALLGHLDEIGALGHPVLIGASRKRFVGALLPEGAPMEARDAPSAVISALAAAAGVWAVRVHDVPATRLALDVHDLWRAGAR